MQVKGKEMGLKSQIVRIIAATALCSAVPAMSATQYWDFDSSSQSFDFNGLGNSLTLNQGSLSLAKQQASSSRAKRVDVRHHHVRELVAEDVVNAGHVPTHKQVA